MMAMREATILLALVALIVAVAALNPKFLEPFNIGTVLRQVAFFGLIAIGETLVIVTGGIDLAPGSIIALSGVVVALLMKKGMAITASVALTLLLCAAIGLWHGLFVTKLGVPPFIITLGTLSMARGAAAVITKGWPIIGLPKQFALLGQGEVLHVPVPTLFLVAVFVAAHIVMNHTALGRYIYAVGGNIEAARLSGINVDAVRNFCYIASALLAGLSGILIASRLEQGQPNVGVAYELQAIAAAVIGGTSLMGGEGSVLGTVIGASIMAVLYNALILLEVSPYWHDIAIGAVVVVAVTVDVLRARRRKR